MDYTKFEQIFNEEIFEKSKPKLLETIGKEPNRYIGLFRPTKPKGKLLQNLLQSHEIRMGNAFEVLIENYLRILGYEILQKNFPKERLNIDQHFKKGDKIYFVEQKIRDDHDSSKKRGQIDNFEKKLNLLGTIHNWKNLIGIFYFIDPDIKKNKKYYTEELKRMQKDYNIELHLQYGKDLFQFLQSNDEIWDEILIFLKKWKDSIPELPEINFDFNAKETFDEIKDLEPGIFRRLFSNDEVFNQIIMTLFPYKKTLNLLKDYFYEKKAIPIYNTLYEELKKRLD
jgi:Holliday junction resolvase-like predicted endonuclease